MPQLVKGGKHTFGWSIVRDSGKIVIPPEALEEYNFKEVKKLIVIPGSQTSGGFGLVSPESLSSSRIGKAVMDSPALSEYLAPEGETIDVRGKPYCWLELRNSSIEIPKGSLSRYGIKPGDHLLVIRGSGLAVGFAVRGPIVEEARKHPELDIF